ncbi:MAG: sensor histidine kinase [Micromonosporaceae bacterium]|nr:sensor histidine kinase [Micromonosporaceae bacterium]
MCSAEARPAGGTDRWRGYPDPSSTRHDGRVGLEAPLWRALAVFRLAALGYAFLLVLNKYRQFAHPAAGWLVLAGMGAWTLLVWVAYREPRRRGWQLLLADLVVTAGLLLVTGWIGTGDRWRGGAGTMSGAWIAAPVLAWAISGGRRRGTVAAIVIGGVDLVLHRDVTVNTIDSAVLLLLCGIVVGHVARLTVDAQARLQRAVELEASTRERERLARGMHDSVLQALALVQRRGAELGGEAAALGRLAGDQGAALRALVVGHPPQPDGVEDLGVRLDRFSTGQVAVAAPATPVPVSSSTAAEVTAAVGSALDNVSVHCGPGAHAWVLLEDEPAAVTVTVRDNGPGIAPGRLEEAAADGRLGVSQSIQGRIRDLGGTVTITSAPGAGTEVELRIPRRVPGRQA